jgi:hypothetical protein
MERTEPSLRFQTDSVTPLTVRVTVLSPTQRPSGVTVLRDTWLYTRVRPPPGFLMSSKPRSNGNPMSGNGSSKGPRPRWWWCESWRRSLPRHGSGKNGSAMVCRSPKMDSKRRKGSVKPAPWCQPKSLGSSGKGMWGSRLEWWGRRR